MNETCSKDLAAVPKCTEDCTKEEQEHVSLVSNCYATHPKLTSARIGWRGSLTKCFRVNATRNDAIVFMPLQLNGDGPVCVAPRLKRQLSASFYPLAPLFTRVAIIHRGIRRPPCVRLPHSPIFIPLVRLALILLLRRAAGL